MEAVWLEAEEGVGQLFFHVAIIMLARGRRRYRLKDLMGIWFVYIWIFILCVYDSSLLCVCMCFVCIVCLCVFYVYWVYECVLCILCM